MLNNDGTNTRVDKAKKFWDLKGSWVLLGLIGFSMFLAGAGFMSWVHLKDMQIQRVAYDAEVNQQRARTREINGELKVCLAKLTPEASDVDTKEMTNAIKDNTTKVKDLTNKLDKDLINGKD